jgi:hypothetical protein
MEKKIVPSEQKAQALRALAPDTQILSQPLRAFTPGRTVNLVSPRRLLSEFCPSGEFVAGSLVCFPSFT